MCVRGGLHRLDVALSLAGVVVLMVAWTSKRLCSVSTEEVADTRANINTLAVTSSGSIQGHVIQSHTGGAVVEYLGIPYALPPVGDRRYADPETYQKLPDNFTASDMMASCVQRRDLDQFDPATWTPSNAESEDCLYLNIWVPQTSKTKLPTMVWIYGGGFYSGSSSLSIYNGTTLASYGEVIVVTFNYRVGSLGFLSTGDGRITGNFGLKDQVLALKWIHDHISSFGGSADKVTLFGESSGASSVGLHMMSPMSQQYFDRAILQSGAPNCHWAFMSQERARISSQNFFKDVKCEQHDDILKCLRQLDTTTILQEEWKTPEEYLNFAWVPTVDGQFLTDDPMKILVSGEFAKDKDVLAGVNCQEGSIWLTALPSFDKATDSLQTAEQFNEAVKLMTPDLTSYLQGRIHRAYQPGDVNNGRYNRNNLDLLSGDRSFTCPTRYFMSTLLQHDQSGELPEGSPDARGQPSRYFYRFCHRASTDRMADWMGVTHGAEIQWIFGEPLDRLREFTQEEAKLSKVLMSYWAHFAETGNPNIANLPFWEPFTSDHPNHLSVSDPVTLSMSSRGFRDLLCNIWNDIDQETGG